MNSKTRPHIIFILLTSICAFISGWPINTHQPVASAPLTNQSIKMKRELDTFFNSYELLEIDSRQVAQQVRLSGGFGFATPRGNVDLVLAPHDMRGPNYRATRVSADGVLLPLALGPAHTFKGVIAGVPGSQARFTIEEDRIEGSILRDGVRYHLEPARRFSSSANVTDFVFYRASDVIHNIEDACSVSLSEKVYAASRQIETTPRTNVSTLRPIELATEADHEYVSSLGGTTNAINDILSIMNQVEGVYETELGLTFQIVFQNAWETPADPYTSTADSTQLLNEFSNYWNANFASVKRDLAHMWTGRNMGGVLGRAYQSVTCAVPSHSYGLSRLDDRLPLKYNTPAHEIAHNLGATHAEQIPECNGSIMRPTATSQLTFCQFSRSEIAQYVEQTGHCLTSFTSTRISGRVTDVNGKPISGVDILAVGSSFRMTQTDAGGGYVFNDLIPGGNYRVTPSKQNYAFTPEDFTVNELTKDQVANFTVKTSPDGPVLVTEGGSNQAITLDSVTLLRSPFPVFTSNNFSADRRTRVLLFAYNAGLLPSEDVSAVKAQAEDALGNIYVLVVESVRPVPSIDWLSQITVKLPNELSNGGEIMVTISLRGATSNKALIRIAPSAGVVL
jgi:Metallo-peptidase family M12/Carboxypeptidase regulatory-like domain